MAQTGRSSVELLKINPNERSAIHLQSFPMNEYCANEAASCGYRASKAGRTLQRYFHARLFDLSRSVFIRARLVQIRAGTSSPQTVSDLYPALHEQTLSGFGRQSVSLK